MTAVYFDTHEAITRFQGGGFETRQAECLVEVLKETQSASAENLATKADLEKGLTALKSDMKELKSDLKEVEMSLRGEIQSIRVELGYLKWMMGATFAAVFSLVLKTFFF